MKIVVYAISKNEEKFARRFMESMSEADEVVVLDTGSTDGTAEILRECGAKVQTEIISPWRFDVARNRALELVPDDADLCAAVDLDEVFEKGWRKKLEAETQKGVKQVKYLYVWSHTPSGGDGYAFYGEKIHARHGFKWVNPVHEVLAYEGENYISQVTSLRLDHYPDPEKPRSQYLPLLELAVRENPENDRNVHYLGREYMYYGMYEKSIAALKKHLEMKSATWNEERSASMRYIGADYLHLGNLAEAERWYLKSVAEAPEAREPLAYLAELYYVTGNYSGLLFASEKALNIKDRRLTYITDPVCYGPLFYDYASIACYRLGMFEKALGYVDEAIAAGGDERVRANRELILDEIERKK